MTEEEAGLAKKLKCKCGRTIVTANGSIYSTNIVAGKAS